MLFSLLQDAAFAAVAAIGFSSISHPPRAAYKYCALIAAVGHSLRFGLMAVGMHIVPAGLVAALSIGLLAVLIAPRVKCPPETFSFPALLPMIPGMYAYRTVQALVLCLANEEEGAFHHYLYLLGYNGLMCAFIILALVVGATMPIFLLKRRSFSATASVAQSASAQARSTPENPDTAQKNPEAL